MKRRRINKKINPLPSKILKKDNNVNNVNSVLCEYCNLNIPKHLLHSHKRTNEHKARCGAFYKENNIEIVKSGFKSRVNTYRINK